MSLNKKQILELQEIGKLPLEKQKKKLEEFMKKLSPEEIEFLKRQQCLFCGIVDGRIKSKKIYEDESVMGILDINPANPGHVLLLPKEHYSIMPQVPEDEIAHLFVVLKTISNAALRGLGVQGTNIIVQNGIAAGQKAQHFMIHIIPRKEEDGINFELPKKDIKESELETIQKKLAAKLGAVKEPKSIPNVQELIKPKEEKIVEAEFKQVKEKEGNDKREEKIAKVNEGKQKKEEDKKQKKGDVGLDDIARIIGVK